MRVSNLFPVFVIGGFLAICGAYVLVEPHIPKVKYCENDFDCPSKQVCSEQGTCYVKQPYDGTTTPKNYRECQIYNAPIVKVCVPFCEENLSLEQFSDEYYLGNCLNNCATTQVGMEPYPCSKFSH